MKRFCLPIAFIFISCFLNSQPVVQFGQLQVKGTNLTNAQLKPVVLHGISLGWHNLWPRFYNAGVVNELVQKWNCTVVRASMGIELNDSGYLKSPAKSERLIRKVIDASVKNGVYVIVDWHDHNIHQAEAISFFSRIAKDYGHLPNIIYEVFNEPDYETWEQVKAYSREVIKAIRTYDSDNIILVGTPRWDQDIHLAAANPLTGFSNIMYTMHFYAGTHKKWLRDRTEEAIHKGLPVFISECAAMEASGDGPIDEAEWQAYVSWMEKLGLSWVAWSVSDKNETCSMLLPAAGSKGKWKEAHIKPWGKIARQTIAALKN